jgi:hypothetical protein
MPNIGPTIGRFDEVVILIDHDLYALGGVVHAYDDEKDSLDVILDSENTMAGFVDKIPRADFGWENRGPFQFAWTPWSRETPTAELPLVKGRRRVHVAIDDLLDGGGYMEDESLPGSEQGDQAYM